VRESVQHLAEVADRAPRRLAWRASSAFQGKGRRRRMRVDDQLAPLLKAVSSSADIDEARIFFEPAPREMLHRQARPHRYHDSGFEILTERAAVGAG